MQADAGVSNIGPLADYSNLQAKGASKGRMSPQTHFQSLPSQNQVPKGGSQAGRLAYIYILDLSAALRAASSVSKQSFL